MKDSYTYNHRSRPPIAPDDAPASMTQVPASAFAAPEDTTVTVEIINPEPPKPDEPQLEWRYRNQLIRMTNSQYERILKSLIRLPYTPQSPEAHMPMRKPAKSADILIWAVYRHEKMRRRVVKGRLGGKRNRARNPHDVQACDVCREIVERMPETVPSLQEIADRAHVSRSHISRVFSSDPLTARGRAALEIMRRIAHDGLGISLDELAQLVID